MTLPKFTAGASLYRHRVNYRASDASITMDCARGTPGVVAAFNGIDPRCGFWGACCLARGSAYCCNHYYGICVSPE
jgi:hypothetical protein